MILRFVTIGILSSIAFGCGEKEDECMSDDDCADGQTCVISHDHEGDDHDHGGICEESDTAE